MSYSINAKYRDFIENRLGGASGLISLVDSLIVYCYEEEADQLPSYDKDLCLSYPTPVVALAITNIGNDSFALEMLYRGNKLIAVLSEHVLRILYGIQEIILDDPKNNYSEEEYGELGFIGGKVCQIEAQNGVITRLRMLSHDDVAPVVRDFVSRNIEFEDKDQYTLSETDDVEES